MANKSAEEILKGVIKPYDLEGRHHHDWNVPELSISEASRQLYEATMAIIGEDENEFVRVADNEEPVQDYETVVRNQLRAELRAKARAFYGITGTEQEGSADNE